MLQNSRGRRAISKKKNAAFYAAWATCACVLAFIAVFCLFNSSARAVGISYTGNTFVTKTYVHADGKTLPDSVTLSFYYTGDDGQLYSLLSNPMAQDEELQSYFVAKSNLEGGDYSPFSSADARTEYFNSYASREYQVTIPVTGTTSTYNTLIELGQGISSGAFGTAAWPVQLTDTLLLGQALGWLSDDGTPLDDRLSVVETAGNENQDWTPYARFYIGDTAPRIAEASEAGYEVGVDIVPSISLSTQDFTEEDRAFEFEVVNWPNVHIQVTKEWNDNNDLDQIRPESVTFALYRDGADTGQTLTLTADDGWTGSFTAEQYEHSNNFSTSDSDREYVYEVREVSTVPGYDSSVSVDEATGAYTFTNTHIPTTPTTTDITVTKNWVDAENVDALRTDSVTVQLLANNIPVPGSTLELTENTQWQGTFPGVSLYDENGALITYSVTETPVPTGYEMSVGGDATNGFTITNTHTPSTINVSVTKAWSDGNNQDGLRPTSVDVQLFANGTPVSGAAATLTQDGGWTHTFTGLAENANGAAIDYSVRETAEVTGYTSESGGTAATGLILTNTHIPATTTITVSKEWSDADNQDNLRPASVTVQLLANGQPVENASATLSAEGGWTATFAGVPVYAAGSRISYSVQEEEVAGYSSQVNATSETSFTIVNTHVPATTSLTVNKAWSDGNNQDGKRTGSVTVQLMADGVAVPGQTAELNDTNSWTHTFTDLPVNKVGAVGQTVDYSVSETTVPAGYQPSVSGSLANGITVTNSHTPATQDIKVTKEWVDGNNQDGLRTDSVTVQLYANDTPVAEKTLTLSAGNGWTDTFTALPVYEGGTQINYSVRETGVPTGYEESYSGTAEDGFVITNTHTPATTDIRVNKVWNDDNNRDQLRPASVTVQLYANGVALEEHTLSLDEAGSWSGVFEAVPVYDAGTQISYSVVETTVPESYSVSYSGDASGGFTVTNTRSSSTVDVTVSKIWSDDNNQDGLRPASVTVTLQANGSTLEGNTAVLSEDNSWTHTFAGLAENEAGTKIVYSVLESEVPEGYDVSYGGDAATGLTVTNTHASETMDITVSKVWDDSNDADKLRPGSVTVQLYAGSQALSGKTLVLNADNNWKGTFTGLDVYKDGQRISYSVAETAVHAQYSVSYSGDAGSGFVVTNTHTPAPAPEQPSSSNDTPKEDLPATGDSTGAAAATAASLGALGLLAAGAGAAVKLRRRSESR